MLDNSNKLYSIIAGVYDLGLWLTGYKLAVRYFINILPFNRDDRLEVLDAGCGTGLYTFAILKHFPHVNVTAFDLNSNMTERMQQTSLKVGLEKQIKIFNADVLQPLFLPKGKFDLIITGGVLEYVDIDVAVKNLKFYLKPGGFFLNSSVKDNMLTRLLGKLYKFVPHSRRDNLRAFTNNGFSLLQTRSLFIIKEAHLFQKQ